MANIKDLKKKIKSTKGTLKITTAMKLVSASKLNRAQMAIQGARPYADELSETIKTVSALVQDYSHEFLKERSGKKALMLVVSADRGLCGGYNSQLYKEVNKQINESDLDFKVHFIGKKVWELLRKDVNEGKKFEFSGNQANFAEVKKVADELSAEFKSGEVDSVHIAYNVFVSAIQFIPTIKQVLPFTLDEGEKEELKEKFPFDFKYDPSPAAILDSLIPEAYVNSIYTCYLDGVAAEHGARMAAMDSAAGNCKEAISSLTLKMNKLRQAAITTELIEVVSGAEALNG